MNSNSADEPLHVLIHYTPNRGGSGEHSAFMRPADYDDIIFVYSVHLDSGCLFTKKHAQEAVDSIETEEATYRLHKTRCVILSPEESQISLILNG